MAPKVTVVLVNYNTQHYMEAFFTSLAKQDYTNMDIILVDNCSQDASIDWLKEYAKDVKLIQMKENVGFGEGCNVGMREAIAQGTDYVLLLNLDTVLEDNLVSELVTYADERTVTTASICCGTKEEGTKEWYAGGKIDKSLAVVDQMIYKNAEKNCYHVGFISGCCMLLHKKVIEKVGYFDKDYYLYYEDTDYCIRLQKAGIFMCYITTSGLWHSVGASSAGGNEMSCSTQYYVTRNRLLFAERHAGLLENRGLHVLRQILSERAFFDGNGHEKYWLYIKAAVEDYLAQHYGRGFYGNTLIQDRYYMAEGFHEREEDEEKFWYWAKSRSARIYLANPEQEDIIYTVTFDLSVPEKIKRDASLKILADGKEVGVFQMPVLVSFLAAVSKEGLVCLELLYRGKIGRSTEDGNERLLCYQVLNVDVRKWENTEMKICWGRSFLDEESDQEKDWRWSVEKEASIYLINNMDRTETASVEFEVIPFAEDTESEVVVYENDVRMACGNMKKKQKLLLEIAPHRITELRIKTDYAVLTESGGLRNICFCISDFIYTHITEEISMSQGFYPQETDGTDYWNWAGEKEAEITFLYADSCQLDMEFLVDCAKVFSAETFKILLDGKAMGDFKYQNVIRLTVDNTVCKKHSLQILTGHLPYKLQTDCRKLAFRVVNLRIKTSMYQT